MRLLVKIPAEGILPPSTADVSGAVEHWFNMDSFDTIEFLKDKICFKTKIPVDRMTLYFGCQELCNGSDTLEDCGLDNDSPIHVVPRVSPKVVAKTTSPGIVLHGNVKYK